MKFSLVDQVLERSEDRIVAIKTVTTAEEYLQDHFPDFPVLPGVLMIEALVQAARELVGEPRLVLGEVKALRYGSFVRPGETLRVDVRFLGRTDDGMFRFKGQGTVMRPGDAAGTPAEGTENAVNGRFTMRPIRIPDSP